MIYEKKLLLNNTQISVSQPQNISLLEMKNLIKSDLRTKNPTESGKDAQWWEPGDNEDTNSKFDFDTTPEVTSEPKSKNSSPQSKEQTQARPSTNNKIESPENAQNPQTSNGKNPNNQTIRPSTLETTTEPENQTREQPFLYNKWTATNSGNPSAFEERQIRIFLDIFRSIRVVSRKVTLPFKESESMYDERFLSEKAPLILLSEAKNIGFLTPCQLAERATLANFERIKKAHMNYEVTYFRDSKSLSTEIFSSIEGEDNFGDTHRLAILDSFKILSCLYLATFSFPTCFNCRSKQDQNGKTANDESNSGHETSEGDQVSKNTRCKGTCQFLSCSGQKNDQTAISKLFDFGVKCENQEFNTRFDFRQIEDSKLKEICSKEELKQQVENLISVTRFRSFIPKDAGSRIVEI